MFGLPIVTFGLQTGLVYRMEYGLAISAAAMAAVYALVAGLLLRRPALRLLAGAFAVIAGGFATAAIPLAVDGHWTGGAWALEAAGLAWVGVRQRQAATRWSGLVLLLLAVVALAAEGRVPGGAPAFVNAVVFGSGLLAAGAVLTAWCLDAAADAVGARERWLGRGALLLGGLCWLGVGSAELQRVLAAPYDDAAAWLWLAGSALLSGLAALWLRWPALAAVTAVVWPMMAVTGLASAAGSAGHVLVGWAALPWLVFALSGFWLLTRLPRLWPLAAVRAGHAAHAWILLWLAIIEAAWLAGEVLRLGATLAAVASLLPLLAAAAAVLWWTAADASALPRWYRDAVAVPASLLSLAWISLTVSLDGAWPIPYVPLLNPLAVAGILILAMAATTGASLRTTAAERWPAPSSRQTLALAAGGGLLIATLEVARTVHHWGDVAYAAAPLLESATFQAGIAVAWSLGALAAMGYGARLAVRAAWLAGAGLLGIVLVKLFLVDLAGIDSLARIVSFLVVGILTLLTGYLWPLPPRPASPVSGASSGSDA